MIVIDNPRYGIRSAFADVDEAHRIIRACGPEFADVTLTMQPDETIRDERGEIVGARFSDPDFSELMDLPADEDE